MTSALPDHQSASDSHIDSSPIPTAVPLAPSSAGAFTPVSGQLDESRPKTTPAFLKPEQVARATAPPPPARRVVGRKQLETLAASLSERDEQVLVELTHHRFLTTLQLGELVFTDHVSCSSAHRVCRRTLLRLHHAGLLRSLGRRVGGHRAGSSATIWQLSPGGARLSERASGHRPSVSEPSPRILQHCLAVADAHLQLRALPSVAVEIELEPACWRRYSGIGGETRWLQPDLAATVRGRDGHGDFEDRWFIEVDLATESVATLHRKCRQYADYRASGQEQADGGVFPLVLWLLEGRRANERGQQLAAKVQRDSRLEPALFRYATPDDLGTVVLGDAS